MLITFVSVLLPVAVGDAWVEPALPTLVRFWQDTVGTRIGYTTPLCQRLMSSR
jgi:hypothetical protein